ncbi:hypothetical protein EJ110_NYTH46301 [Nymphaea thermarum]|nr:hypothetical protein EJ110_NYTH46301 [Nymphaea thermarum]
MSSRATVYGRALIRKLGEKGAVSLNAEPTVRKMSSYAIATANPGGEHTHGQKKQGRVEMRGDYVPVAVALGLIVLSASLGIYTATHQLAHAPNVYVSKKKRETVPEVKEPDYAVRKAEDFVSKSVFRRIAHVQEPKRDRVVPDTIRGDPVTVFRDSPISSDAGLNLKALLVPVKET